MQFKDIGRRIREIRRIKGMTQKELAKKLGVSWEMISRYENGKSNPLGRIFSIARALGVDPTALLQDSYSARQISDSALSKGLSAPIPLITELPGDLRSEPQLKRLVATTPFYFNWLNVPDLDNHFALMLSGLGEKLINRTHVPWTRPTIGVFQFVKKTDSESTFLCVTAQGKLAVGKLGSGEIPLARLVVLIVDFADRLRFSS